MQWKRENDLSEKVEVKRNSAKTLRLAVLRLAVSFFSLFVILLCGCAPKEKPTLYVYCSETFWYVMQEEGIVFHEIYGFNLRIVPVRGKIIEDKTDTVKIESGADTDTAPTPAPWRSRPTAETGGTKTGNALHTGLNKEISDQLEALSNNRFGDIFITDSQNQINKLRQLALISGEPPLCHLTLTLLTATDNPKQLTSVKSVLDGQYKLGIVDPAIDGLGEASWNIVTKIISEKITSDDGSGQDTVPENLRQFSRQYELLEALESGEIDAALVWNTASVT
ncbi:MAG: substrate-binding domain-containing protein, partial [Planctomycetaceae bacterium]|nr:substrate-binding domain-containing protein [Planctomycetaceae bacterium]